MVTKTIKRGFKQSEVGIIPVDWNIQNITKNSTLKARIGWQGLTTDEYLKTGKFFLVTGTDFKNGRIDWENCVYVDEKRYSQDKHIQLKDGDILVTKDGTIGKIAYIDTLKLPATLNSGVFVIRPLGNEYLPLFLFYIFTSSYFLKFLNQLKAGSTINHLYQKDFVEFNFVIPPLPEQGKISKILSDTDKLIDKLENLITKKKNIKQGAMQELLIGKRRLEGFNEKWKIETLGNIGIFSKGKGLSKNDITNSGKLKCIPYTSIYTDFQEIIDYGQINLFTSFNDVVIVNSPHLLIAGSSNMLENIGKATAYVNNTNVAIGGDIILFKTNINVYFLSYLLSTDSHRKKIIRLSQGSTIRHVYASTFQNYEIKLPSTKEEQSGIAQTLFDMDLVIKELEKKKEKYKMIKQGMMQKLLTGEIRLK